MVPNTHQALKPNVKDLLLKKSIHRYTIFRFFSSVMITQYLNCRFPTTAMYKSINSTRGLVETQVLSWHSNLPNLQTNPNVEFIDIKISYFISISL